MVAGEVREGTHGRSGWISGFGVASVADPPPLHADERRRLHLIRRFGVMGALLMAAGSLGAGAAPVFNPVLHIRVLNLFPRMPTVSLGCAFAGMAMVVIAWLWLGRYVRPGRPRMLTPQQLNRTLLTWAAPLAVIPPMFSTDVYTYLGQCKTATSGINPYALGPAQALGVADPLVRSIPTIWRDTPSPYGPLFLSVCRAIPSIVGDHVVAGVLLERVLALCGVALIVWALPRLARRFGVQPVSALWLGAANPLVLWHLVAGAHNDALMLGLMLAGLEVALRAMPRVRQDEPVPAMTRSEIGHLLAGAVIITCGAAIKIPAAAALGFLGVILARRWGGRIRHLALAAVATLVVSGVIIVAASVGSGYGFGWVDALSVPGKVRSWLAPTNAAGFLAGGLGVLLGLGDHTEAAIATARLLGTVGYIAVSVVLLWSTFRGRRQPMIALGLCLGAVVVFGASVQPWYLLWAAIPLAAGARAARFRVVAAILSAVVAMLIFPSGSTVGGHAFVVPEAAAAAAIVVVLALLAVRGRIPVFRERRPVEGDEHRTAVMPPRPSRRTVGR